MPSFTSVPVQQPKVTVKLGNVLQKVQDRADSLQEELKECKEKCVELQRDNTSKDEKIDILQGLLDDRNTQLSKERQVTKQLTSEVEVLKYAFHEKKISKKEMEKITQQVRSSGFSRIDMTSTNSKSKTPDVSTWASSSIEMEIQELIQRLCKAEAQVALTQEICTQLEDKNKELVEQRNQHMKHTSLVLKKKNKIAEELQALKDSISNNNDEL